MASPEVSPAICIRFRIIVAFTLVLFTGCASNAPWILKWHEVPPTTAQPIDGDWKDKDGGIYRFEKGRARFINLKRSNPFFDVVVIKNIQEADRGRYTLEVLATIPNTQKTGFRTGELQLVSATEMVFQFDPDPITKDRSSKQLVTNVRFDNESSYRQALEVTLKVESDEAEARVELEREAKAERERLESSREDLIVSQSIPVDNFEACISTTVDALLELLVHQINGYRLYYSTKDDDFQGYIAYRNGAVLRISEKNWARAISSFSLWITDYAKGLEYSQLKSALEDACLSDSV